MHGSSPTVLTTAISERAAIDAPPVTHVLETVSRAAMLHRCHDWRVVVRVCLDAHAGGTAYGTDCCGRPVGSRWSPPPLAQRDHNSCLPNSRGRRCNTAASQVTRTLSIHGLAPDVAVFRFAVGCAAALRSECGPGGFPREGAICSSATLAVSPSAHARGPLCGVYSWAPISDVGRLASAKQVATSPLTYFIPYHSGRHGYVCLSVGPRECGGRRRGSVGVD